MWKLILKIIATVFIGGSFLTSLVKNAFIFGDDEKPFKALIISSSYSWGWRIFIIVAIWLL